MNRTRAILVALVVVGMLAGCAPRDAEPTPPVAEAPVETPTPEPTRPTLEQLELTTEGLGELVVGQPVPAISEDLAIVRWEAGYCESGKPDGTPYAGAWVPNYPEVFPFVLDSTTDGLAGGDLTMIHVAVAGIPTSEGITVGATRAELEAAYGTFDDEVSGDWIDLYVLTGTTGQLTFEVVDDVVESMNVTPLGSELRTTARSDAGSACA